MPYPVATDPHEWVHDFCNVYEAWALPPPRAGGRSQGEGIIIAHPDTGWTDHPELPAENYVRDPKISKCFIDPEAASAEADFRWSSMFESHGTSTGSVIVSARGHTVNPLDDMAARRAKFPDDDPSAFVSGIAPKATLIPFRVAGRLGVLLNDRSDRALAKAIDFCIGLQRGRVPEVPAMDVAVMSVSLGRTRGGVESKIVEALTAAEMNGIVVVAAAGQLPGCLGFLGGLYRPAFPGCDEHVIGVGGCTVDKEEFKGGFYGPEIDISAPAEGIWRADADDPPNFAVDRSEGTSHATAITAGACALWQAHHGREHLKTTYGPARLTRLFRYCLAHSADPVGGVWDPARAGAGLLDVQALLNVPLPAANGF